VLILEIDINKINNSTIVLINIYIIKFIGVIYFLTSKN